MMRPKKTTTLNILLLHARTIPVTLHHERIAFGDALARVDCNLASINLIDHLSDAPLPRFVDAIIIGGSPESVEAPVNGFRALRHLLDDVRSMRIPTFAICFGAQFIAKHFGGEVRLNGGRGEHGTTMVRVSDAGREHPVFQDFPETFDVQQSHDDHIDMLPPDADLLVGNDHCPVQAFSLEEGRIICTQFHPERTPEWYDRIIADTQLPEARRLHYRSLRSVLRPTPHAHSLLRRFVDDVRRRRG